MLPTLLNTFRRVGSIWGLTSSIRVDVTDSNPKDVLGRRLTDWKLAMSINCFVFECHGHLDECTIRLGYAFKVLQDPLMKFNI